MKKKVQSNIEDSNGIRISYHEKVCAERMKTLFKAIDEMRKLPESDWNICAGTLPVYYLFPNISS